MSTIKWQRITNSDWRQTPASSRREKCYSISPSIFRTLWSFSHILRFNSIPVIKLLCQSWKCGGGSYVLSGRKWQFKQTLFNDNGDLDLESRSHSPCLYNLFFSVTLIVNTKEVWLKTHLRNFFFHSYPLFISWSPPAFLFILTSFKNKGMHLTICLSILSCLLPHHSFFLEECHYRQLHHHFNECLLYSYFSIVREKNVSTKCQFVDANTGLSIVMSQGEGWYSCEVTKKFSRASIQSAHLFLKILIMILNLFVVGTTFFVVNCRHNSTDRWHIQQQRESHVECQSNLLSDDITWWHEMQVTTRQWRGTQSKGMITSLKSLSPRSKSHQQKHVKVKMMRKQ